MALFRRRRVAVEREVRELQAAIVAVCETADADRSENAKLRTRVGLVENQVDLHQRSLVHTNEALARRLEAAAQSGRFSSPLPPPPPSARPAVSQVVGATDRETTGSITYLQGLAETVVRATANQAAAMDALRARQTELSSRMDGVETSIGSRVDAAQDRAVDELEARLHTRLDQLRDAQVRLANEQARHEIATRAELAAVVDRFRLTTARG